VSASGPARIAVYLETGRGWQLPLGRTGLTRAMDAMCRAVGLEDASLELRLTGDAEIEQLNREFLGCPGPTNVLSFPASDVTLDRDVPDGDVEDYYPDDDGCGCEDAPTDEDSAEASDMPSDAVSDADTDTQLHLGALALSLDAVAREAFLYGQDPVEHGLRLLAHGLAHLAGYDHGPDMDAFADTALAAALLDKR